VFSYCCAAQSSGGILSDKGQRGHMGMKAKEEDIQSSLWKVEGRLPWK